MSAEPPGSKDDLFVQLNDPQLIKRTVIVAIVTAVIAAILFAMWYFNL